MKLGIFCLIENVDGSPQVFPLIRFPKDDSILPKLEATHSELGSKVKAAAGPEHNRLVGQFNRLEKRIGKLKEDGDTMHCLPSLMGKIFSTGNRAHWEPMLTRNHTLSEEELFDFLVHCRVGSSVKLGKGSKTARDFLRWAKEKRVPLILLPNGLVLNLANLIWLPNNRRRGKQDLKDRPPPLLLHWCIGNVLKQRQEEFALRKATASDFCHPDTLAKLSKLLLAEINREEITNSWRNINNKLAKEKLQVPPENPFSIAFPKDRPNGLRGDSRSRATRPRSRGKGHT